VILIPGCNLAKSNADFFAKLQKLKHKLDTAPTKVMATIVRNCAEEALSLTRDGFATETNPYGERWARKKFSDGRNTLSGKTSRLKNFAVQVSRTGFRLHSTVNYAVFHQGGTGIYGPKGRRIVPVRAKALKIPGIGFRKSVAGSPKRLMVPTKQRGLPPHWSRAFKEVSSEVIRAHFK
jgi:hypothetical protein